MTFLILLASVAVLEYLLRKDLPRDVTRRGEPSPPKTREREGLAALGSALEEQGRGPAPGPPAGPAAEVSRHRDNGV